VRHHERAEQKQPLPISGVKYKKCCLPKDEAARAALPPRARAVIHRGRLLAMTGNPSPEALDLADDYFERKEAGEGCSAQVMRFSQPLIEAADGDAEKIERAMTLGMVFWNIVNLSAGTVGGLGGGSPSRRWMGARISSMRRGSLVAGGCDPSAKRLTLNGLDVSERMRVTEAVIWSGVRYAAPRQPSAPAFETAATRSSEGIPPSGAWIRGYSRPSARVHSVYRMATLRPGR
jgi:hypothetical protein